MRISRLSPVFPLLILFIFILSACTPAVTPTPTMVSSTPTSTPLPPTALTVCLGQEPASLYPIDNPSFAARAVLSALYDGPIDTLSYGYQPVILETLPDLDNGDAELFQVDAYVGDEVVDADGMPVTLSEGIRVRPSGCRSDECAVTYDGRGTVPMDQLVVTFRLLPGLRWSDGEPLTAEDSVYSYLVAHAAGNNYLALRTQAYEAADDDTIQWWGRPGFIDPHYAADFFFPLPSHLWSGISFDSLADSEAARLNPAGWGPYVIEEWEAGESITLVKNRFYFREDEGLPLIDVLTFIFTPDPGDALAALLAGDCDLIDPSVPLDGQVALLMSLQEQGQLTALFTTTPVMEQLAFGILPAEYDNGYNPAYDRPDYFSDYRLRQAVSMCIDRQAIIDTVLYGLSDLPGSYVPSAHPLYDPAYQLPAYDPAAAALLLEEIGWRDLDGVASTPRQAWGIPGLTDGTPFEVEYLTTTATQRLQVSSLVADSLLACGLKVDVRSLDQADLYASGPDGPLFGRSFELAEFAMGSLGFEPPCDWFTSARLPGEDNRWVGTNLSGFSDSAFDLACSTASQSLPDEPVRLQAFSLAQSIFTRSLPVVPLYWRIRVAAASPRVCGLSLDSTSTSLLWNLESLGIGMDCLP